MEKSKVSDEACVEEYLIQKQNEISEQIKPTPVSTKRVKTKSEKAIIISAIAIPIISFIIFTFLFGFGILKCPFWAVSALPSKDNVSEGLMDIMFQSVLISLIEDAILIALYFVCRQIEKINNSNKIQKQQKEDERVEIDRQVAFSEYKESSEFQNIKHNILLENKKKHDEIDEQIRLLQQECNSKVSKLNEKIDMLNIEVKTYTKIVDKDMRVLENTYGGFLHISDWENLDYIIHLFVTGRAENMKEALHCLDEQKRTEMIVNAVKESALFLSKNISGTIVELGDKLSNELQNIGLKLDSLHETIESLAAQQHADSMETNGLLKNGIVSMQMLAESFETESRTMMADISKTRSQIA